ncbi:unnamed protein product [Rotaria sordida]|uniref:Uncharacterized protein n=1 Tax=Rotaria sordida TaxID=392033 RepID=A0A814F468_9BILA|nr:unnamed protein product [Rotaria sordida]
MLTVHEQEINEIKKVSIRYDNSTRTYYFFYHRTDILSTTLILSYDLNQNQWNIDTIEYNNVFEKNLNDLFNDKKISFEEQVRYIIDYLDNYFINQLQQQQQQQQQNIKTNMNHHNIYSLSWFRHLRSIRGWAMFAEQSAVLQRYSAPEKSTSMDNNEEIISVKALAESFYSNDLYRNDTKTFTSLSEYSNEPIQNQISNKLPAITELWLDVFTQKMNNFRKKIGGHIEEEKLKNLAEKFIASFNGTFQCNVGHKYQIRYDDQTWYFTVVKVEFFTQKNSETTKIPKTKIVFVIDGIPHYVRG